MKIGDAISRTRKHRITIGAWSATVKVGQARPKAFEEYRGNFYRKQIF
jgi:hypothetical protein